MKKGDNRNKRGFTIIEVSLVLAIAGLIFLMVFIALPSLQRSQRDAKRREDVSVFLEAVKKYQTNNRGSLPATMSDGIISDFAGDADMSSASDTSWMGFYKNYLGDNFADPSGEKYGVLVLGCPNGNDICQSGDNRAYNNVLDHLYGLYGNKPQDRLKYRMFVFLGATCSGEKPVKASNPRKIAVVYKLESSVYCSNS